MRGRDSMLAAAAAAALVLPASVPAAAGDTVRVKASDSGRYTVGLYALLPPAANPCAGTVPIGPFALTARASGTMSHVGRYTLTGSACVSFTSRTTLISRTGRFVLTTPSGDTLFGSFTGEGRTVDGTSTFINTAMVEGGTGRFAGTTGTLTFTGGGLEGSLDFSETATGTLTR